MKLITFLIFITLLLNNLYAQTKPLSQWDVGTQMADGDILFYTDVSDKSSSSNGTSKRVNIEIIKAYFFSGNETINADWAFLKALKLAELSSTTIENGIFVNSANGRLALYSGGVLYNLAYTNDLDTFNVSDTTDLSYQSRVNNYSASHFVADLRGTFNGSFRPPERENIGAAGSYYIREHPTEEFTYELYYVPKSGEEDKVALESWVQENYGASGGTWKTNANQTGLIGDKEIIVGTFELSSSSSRLDFNGGAGLDFTDEGGRLGVPFTTNFNFAAVGGQPGTYYIGYETSTEQLIFLDKERDNIYQFVFKSDLIEAIAEVLKWGDPIDIPSDTLDISLGSRFYIDDNNDLFGGGGGTLYVVGTSTDKKTVEVVIEDGAKINLIHDVDNNATINFPKGVTQLSVSGGTGYKSFPIKLINLADKWVAGDGLEWN